MRQDLRVSDVARVVAWMPLRVFCDGGVRHDGEADLRRVGGLDSRAYWSSFLVFLQPAIAPIIWRVGLNLIPPLQAANC